MADHSAATAVEMERMEMIIRAGGIAPLVKLLAGAGGYQGPDIVTGLEPEPSKANVDENEGEEDDEEGEEGDEGDEEEMAVKTMKRVKMVAARMAKAARRRRRR